ncbi:MAG: hypothetical protein ACHP7H_00435 [Hyphomicrobiales bacterium]
MFSAIKNYFNNEVASIETILNGWRSAVKQLEQHAQAKLTEAAAHETNAAFLVAQSEGAKLASQAATDVAVQANSIAQQLKTVVTSSANGTQAA